MRSLAKKSITHHLSQATRNEKKRKRVPTDEIYFVKFAQTNQYAVPKAEKKRRTHNDQGCERQAPFDDQYTFRTYHVFLPERLRNINKN